MSTIYIYTVYFGGPNRHIYKSRISPFCRRYLSPPTHWRHSVATSRDQKIPHTHTHIAGRDWTKCIFYSFCQKTNLWKIFPWHSLTRYFQTDYAVLFSAQFWCVVKFFLIWQKHNLCFYLNVSYASYTIYIMYIFYDNAIKDTKQIYY